MLTISTYLSMTDDDRYAEMKQATIATMDEALFNKYYKPTKNRWRDLVRVWDKVHTHNKHFILTSDIHKIYWGVYPYRAEAEDANLAYLLSLIESELLDNREAYQSWSNWKTFKNVLNHVLDSTLSYGTSNLCVHSIEHHHYLYDRAFYEIVCRKSPGIEDVEYLENYEMYERIINRLIPESTKWTRQQWGDDMNIINALENLYGMEYGDDLIFEQDCLISMARVRDRGRSRSIDLLWSATNLTTLPLTMAQIFGPEDLEGQLTTLFVDAYEYIIDYEKAGPPFAYKKAQCINPVEHLERDCLKNCWLFKLVKEWFDAGVYDNAPVYGVIKGAIFDLMMTCN